jgi:LCP family protein required for cell wall assembly
MDAHMSGTEPGEILEPATRSGRSRRSERAGRAGGTERSGPSDRHRRPDDRSPSRRQVVAIAASSLAVLTVAIGGGAFALYDRLESNIRTVDIGQSPGSSGGEGQPMNLLLIGSDSRAGSNAQYGQDDGARSDTTMLLHVAAGRKSATVASIPRDTMVQLPSCTLPDGTSSAPQLGMFNSAFAIGGAACTVRTVEALSNIPIDHVLVVDFTGFKNIVDAIGGIPVTLAQAVNDPDSHLNLPAGTSIVTGEQALAFVRARHNLGDGSDIGRMGRQQQFLQSALDTMTSNGTLDDPAKLYKILDAATKALTTDPALGSLSALAHLADDVKQVPRANITYLTVPWQWYPQDPNRVEFAPAAQQLFDDLRNDAAVPTAITSLPGGEQKAAGATPGTGASSTPAR